MKATATGRLMKVYVKCPEFGTGWNILPTLTHTKPEAYMTDDWAISRAKEYTPATTHVRIVREYEL